MSVDRARKRIRGEQCEDPIFPAPPPDLGPLLPRGGKWIWEANKSPKRPALHANKYLGILSFLLWFGKSSWQTRFAWRVVIHSPSQTWTTFQRPIWGRWSRLRRGRASPRRRNGFETCLLRSLRSARHGFDGGSTLGCECFFFSSLC